jgi:dTDP-4-amino-4,6-dideoxygalactose transaminase
MKREPGLILGAPQIKKEDILEIVKVIKSGIWVNGPKVKDLSEKFKEYINCKYAIPVSSGTAALHLSLNCLDIKNGDEVITTPFSYPATSHAILYTGAKPVFVDIEKDTFNINPSLIERAISGKTRAILPVHIAGHPCDMDKISYICKKYNLCLIEDSAHAIESWYKNKKIGSTGDLTCFSFDVTKTVAGGMGGMVVTGNEEFAQKIKNRSHFGLVEKSFSLPYETIYPGFKYDMIESCAAIILSQLMRANNNLIIREKYWNFYSKAFSGLREITIPLIRENIIHSRYLYMILLNFEYLKCTRAEFMEELALKNIITRIRFSPIHLHKFYKETYNYKEGDFPVTEDISSRVICLPLSAALRVKDIKYIIEAVYWTIQKFRV